MSILVAAPILLTMTLLVSGIAKLGERRGTQDAMTSLRLPARGTHHLVAGVLPVAEIVVALLLWVPLVPLQVVLALFALVLMLAYLVIIARALTFPEKVECSCFGSLASPTVSRATLARNVLLSLLALVTVVAAAQGSIAHAVVRSPLSLLAMVVVLVVAMVLVVLVLGGVEKSDAEGTATAAPARAEGGLVTPAEAEDDEELADYERTATPAAILQREDGELVSLRQLTSQRAALLVFATEGCGPCERVLDEMPGWIEHLGPVMQVHAVFRSPADRLLPRTLARVEGYALHDPQFTAREQLGSRGTPMAVLLGADGQLAGGPVAGGEQVISFVQEIIEQVDMAQRSGELSATAPTPGPAAPRP